MCRVNVGHNLTITVNVLVVWFSQKAGSVYVRIAQARKVGLIMLFTATENAVRSHDLTAQIQFMYSSTS
jgi:hypothetical protein